ncbi:Cytochrome p450 [Thalictrum thalictroides]|uniref:Cytochrome p450 n=1 Tax=Thalictrum thalictroides TaxID=46969 RepID=A0A7J6V725_THATH|nr:Cytochrome p450 [Thalictrum thalictroides]
MKKREEVRNEGEKNKMSSAGGNYKINDFLDILLDTLENWESKIKLTRENIKAFMFELLIAGTDSSGIVVEWAMSELINHPNILQKAREEIDSVMGKNQLVKESDIQDLPYTQAIFKETLRLHPPIPIFDRESTEDCNIAAMISQQKLFCL